MYPGEPTAISGLPRDLAPQDVLPAGGGRLPSVGGAAPLDANTAWARAAIAKDELPRAHGMDGNGQGDVWDAYGYQRSASDLGSPDAPLSSYDTGALNQIIRQRKIDDGTLFSDNKPSLMGSASQNPQDPRYPFMTY